MDNTVEAPLYVPVREGWFRPSRLAQGPWDPHQQHGGPVAALLVYAIESCLPPGRVIPQLTVDYLRPAPLAELHVGTEVTRDGRRVSRVVSWLEHEGRQVARARAWCVTARPGPVGVSDVPRVPAPLPKESSYHRARFGFGFQEAVELRFTHGSFRHRGPATAWMRLRTSVVAGRQPSPMQRIAAATDLASGISSELDGDQYSYRNLDLSLHVFRQPETSWICMQAASTLGREGSGLSRATLFDEHGALGQSSQSLFIAAREADQA